MTLYFYRRARCLSLVFLYITTITTHLLAFPSTPHTLDTAQDVTTGALLPATLARLPPPNTPIGNDLRSFPSHQRTLQALSNLEYQIAIREAQCAHNDTCPSQLNGLDTLENKDQSINERWMVAMQHWSVLDGRGRDRAWQGTLADTPRRDRHGGFVGRQDQDEI